MAQKGTRLFKIETVEVIEEGTREEPGFYYEYLETAPDAVANATVAKPRTNPDKARAAEKEAVAAAPPQSAPAELTESSSNGHAPAQAPPEAAPPPSLPDEAPTMKFDAEEIGARAEDESALEEEPEELADADIEGVEVVETDEAYEHNSEMVATVEPDLLDADSLLASDSEELVPVFDETEDEAGFAQDEESRHLEPGLDEPEDNDDAALLDEPQAGEGDAAEDLDPPSLDLDEDLPESDAEEDLPELGAAEDLPGPDAEEELPDLGADEDLPEPDADEDLPELDAPKEQSGDASLDTKENDNRDDDNEDAVLGADGEMEEGEGLDDVDLDDIPELPDDLAPLDEPASKDAPSDAGTGNSGKKDANDQKSRLAPAKTKMQEGSKSGSKRGTTRLENTRARTGKLGQTTRTQRAETGDTEGEKRSSRPAPVQQGISAKTHKRITIASYSVVALVVLIIGGHWALTNFGIIEEAEEEPERPRGQTTVEGGDERPEEERQIERQITQASRAYSRLEGHFATAERARQINDGEEFRIAAVAFIRHYWQIKYYLATASRINLQIGGTRVDTGEMPKVESLTRAEREQIAQQASNLGRKKRRIDTWIAQLDMHDINDEEPVMRAREGYERIEQEIQEMLIDEGDVTTLVEQKIDEWLLADGDVGSAVHRIQSGDAEDVPTEATEAIRNGLTALTAFYEAVVLDPNQLTDAWRDRTETRYEELRELTELDGVPAFDEFDEYEPFLEARREAFN